MEKVIRGELDDEPVSKEEKKADGAVPEPEVDRGIEPPVPEFILNIPNITAIDL